MTPRSASGIAQLRKELEGGEPYQRARAALELGRKRHRASAGLLKARLEDRSLLVAVCAAFGLWQASGSTAGIAALVRGLASRDEEVVQTAVTALGRMGPKASGGLIRAFRETGEKNARILSVLGEIGDARSVRFLRRCAKEGGRAAARAAREALRDLEEDQAEDG